MSPQEGTRVNSCSGINKVLVNCNRTSVSSWTPGMDHRKILERCKSQIRSLSTLYRNYQAKEWHSHHLSDPGRSLEGARVGLRFVSSEQPLVHMKEGTEAGHSVLKSLSHPLFSHLGLWLYVTWMQSHSLDFHKSSLFHWIFEVQPILKLEQAPWHLKTERFL